MRTSPSHAAVEAVHPLPHSLETDLDLACLLSSPRVLRGPCLPTEPQWTARSPPFHSFTVLSPTTFSFPLFQPPNAMATLGLCHLLGWPHIWNVPCRHSYSVATTSYFSSLYHVVLSLHLLFKTMLMSLCFPRLLCSFPSLIQLFPVVGSAPPTPLNYGHPLEKTRAPEQSNTQPFGGSLGMARAAQLFTHQIHVL